VDAAVATGGERRQERTSCGSESVWRHGNGPARVLDETAVELEVLEHAVEIVIKLLGGARLGGIAGVVKVLVRVRVRMILVMLVLARIVADLLLGVGCARERGRVGDRRWAARGCMAAVAGSGRRRQRRVDRGAVVEAVLGGRARSDRKEREVRPGNSQRQLRKRWRPLPETPLRTLQTGPSLEGRSVRDGLSARGGPGGRGGAVVPRG
jgi:hypothetical protein